MLSPIHTLFFLGTSLLAVLSSTNAVLAPAGAKMLVTIAASNNFSMSDAEILVVRLTLGLA